MRFKLLVAAATLILTTGAAHATLVAGTATFKDDGPANNAVSLSAGGEVQFSVDLVAGGPAVTIDPFSITETYSHPSQYSTATDQVEADFSFTTPPGSGTVSGAGTGIQFLGVFNAGFIQWNNPATISLSDGTQVNISLADVEGIALGLSTSFSDAATLSLANDPPAVPEPGTLALLGTGLIALGLVLRRRA